VPCIDYTQNPDWLTPIHVEGTIFTLKCWLSCTPGLEVDGADLLLQAAVWYAEKNTDFIDAFNASWMLKHGMEMVYTFDQKHFNRFGGITALLPE
jgi:predicted nucleic acid-binding protein